MSRHGTVIAIDHAHRMFASASLSDSAPFRGSRSGWNCWGWNKESSESNMDREESVYNLIPKKEAKIEKPPRYVSKYSAQVKQEKQVNKSSHRTMGLAKVEAPSTEKFLRKQSKASKVPDSIKPFKEENLKRTPMSTRSDNSLKRPQTKKDFIKSNATAIIYSKPRKPQAASALTKNGDVQLLENSGLVPKFVNKKDYGQIPEYMKQRKEKEREREEREKQERLRQEGLQAALEEERLYILQGLKKNLEELLQQYQRLPLLIDTIRKRAHKEKLESQMRQLERDIYLMEKHKTIYIGNNGGHCSQQFYVP